MSDSAVPLFLLLAVLVVTAWRTALWRPRPLPGVDRQKPWLLGHRGVRATGPSTGSAALPPENTREAFRAAFEAGLDGVECDVQQTRDGVLVLFHDERLADAAITRSTLAELQEIDPAIARLADLLELAKSYPGTVLNLELKLYRRRGGGIERRLAEEVRANDLTDRVLVSSFDPLALVRLRLAAPEFRIALLYSPGLPGLLENGMLAGWLHVDAVHPRFDQVDERLIARAGARELLVNAWTVNDADEVRRLVSLGASGIIADDPSAMKRAAGR
ncbi:MAG: glycerophosphodiester phosphodiesterase [Trueperaceae bacterium]